MEKEGGGVNQRSLIAVFAAALLSLSHAPALEQPSLSRNPMWNRNEAGVCGLRMPILQSVEKAMGEDQR
jgi:hypothetical protein